MGCRLISRKSYLKSFFVGVAALTGLCRTADAMEPGECFPMEQLNRNLATDHQHSVIFANRVPPKPQQAAPDKSPRLGTIFTTNDDGTRGYHIEGNAAIDRPFTRACIQAKLSNVKLFDARKPGVDPDTKIGGSRDAVTHRCLNVTGCAYHDDVLDTADKNGMHVMFQGLAIDKTIHGTPKAGALLTVIGDPTKDKLGALGYSSLLGDYVFMNSLSDVSYRPYALERLK
jgi:hypothetical protein